MAIINYYNINVHRGIKKYNIRIMTNVHYMAGCGVRREVHGMKLDEFQTF